MKFSMDTYPTKLLGRGLEFHVCTINKSAHTKKSLETYIMILVYIYIYIYIVLFGLVKPELGVIPSGQENHSGAEHLNFPGRELNVIDFTEQCFFKEKTKDRLF